MMVRSLLAGAAFLALSASALAQAPSATRALPPGEIRANGDVTFGSALKLGKRQGGKTILQPDSVEIQGAGSTGPVDGMSVLGRSLKARARDGVNPRDLGAFGDGAAHTVAATLGVSTLSGLAGWTDADGQKPYAFISSYPHGVLFNLDLGADAATGATSLTFRATGTLGVEIPTRDAAASGATSLTLFDLTVTADATAITVGTPVTGVGIAAGTTVTAVSGSLGAYTLTLSQATTATVPSGTYLRFSTRPAAGKYLLPVVFTAGISQGDLVSGSCIQPGTQVDYVNPARMEVTLSLPTSGQCAAAETLSFVPSWLGSVSAGMRVSGASAAIPAGTTVTAVNTSTGVVSLSQATTAPMTARSALTGTVAGTKTRTAITFWRPYTDAEAAALEMDRLGLQAALNTAYARNGNIGAAVDVPAGTYRIDAPLILPLILNYDDNRKSLSLGGTARSDGGVVFLPTRDFGPGTAVVSCGDPSATSSNGRGLYQPEGWFCPGLLHDVSLRPLGGWAFNWGLRPKWGGTPVAMSGIKHGPRQHWDRVTVEGFNVGALSAMDHTRLANSTLNNNFIGLRMDDQTPQLHSDDILDRMFIAGNALANISVSPQVWFNGIMTKPYVSNSPYGVYCEPGAGAKAACLQGVAIQNGNLENAGCGAIRDGGIRDGYTAMGASRALFDTTLRNTFVGGYAAFGAPNVPTPVYGCAWTAYFDIATVYGLRIDDVWNNSYTLGAPNPAALVLRVGRLDGFSAFGKGGFSMEGSGVRDLIDRAASANLNVVNGTYGIQGDFWYTGSWQFVTLKGPGFTARPIPFADPGATSLAQGTVLEWGTTGYLGSSAVQRAGQRSGSAVAGVSCQNWASNPMSAGVVPVVCVGGSRLPVLVSAAQPPGTFLKPDTANPGRAVAATSVTDGPAFGIATFSGSASTAWAQPLWPAQQ